jgi:methylated-DNA-[protein]-cysteine S-methyltransferase
VLDVYAATIPTPPGPFTIVSDGEAVFASGWTSSPAVLLALIGPALRPAALTFRAGLGPITEAVTRYLSGDLDAIDEVPVRHSSSSFLDHGWDVLRTVPAGSPVTYAELAAQCGRPGAARAAGRVCARNPASLFVPCHRVVRTGGDPGGFGWGLPVKRWLLDHESGVASLAM